jgi:hypothetical protein
MLTIALPARSSATLRSFGLVICGGVSFIVAFVSYLTGSILWLVLGLLFILTFGTVGMLRPQKTLSVPYLAWNRLAREFSKLARLWVLGICFYAVLVVVGRVGSSLGLRRPKSSSSLWTPRKSLTPEAYHSEHTMPAGGSVASGWIASYLSWTVLSRNYWACCFLPFLILLSALEHEHESNVPTDLYTLF